MIRRDGAAAFGDDGRVRHFRFVANALDVIDDVARIFLKRVVDARFEIGLRAVVVDAKPAAHVHVLRARCPALELDVDARRLDHRGLDLADVRDLAAEVEVQQLEAVFHARAPSGTRPPCSASLTVRPNFER